MKSVPVLLLAAALSMLVPGESGDSNGSIIAWGNNGSGECNVPEPNVAFVEVSAGANHSLGIKEDGSVLAWGSNLYGQCDVPEPNEEFLAISGGYFHSLGLKEDSTIVAWGHNGDGQCTVPSPNEDFVAIAGGGHHSLGLKEDGSIVAWGRNGHGQCEVPEPNESFVAIAAGYSHSLGLKEDGSIVAWGSNQAGQSIVPEPNQDFTGVSGGWLFSAGLKTDSSIVVWGSNEYSQCDVPDPNEGFVGLEAGSYHCVGFKDDGSIVAWGRNTYGQSEEPEPNEGFIAVAGGWQHSLGLHAYLHLTEPDSSTIWTHFDTELPISWAGVYSDSIEILLYRGDVLIESLASSAPNTGSWILSGPVPMSWDPGSDYMIYIEDGLSNAAWSDSFTIAPSEGQEVIEITEPDTSTIWNNIEMNRTISWHYPAMIACNAPLSGDSVSISLYKDAVYVDTLISSMPNTGTWVFSDSLPDSWVNGSDYRVHVVDNLANFGWSGYFTIETDLGMHNPEETDVPYLFPIAPNPSEGVFTISYFIPQASEVTIALYDISGKLISEAVEGERSPGLHQLQIGGMPSGIYFCRMCAGSDVRTERFVVIR